MAANAEALSRDPVAVDAQIDRVDPGSEFIAASSNCLLFSALVGDFPSAIGATALHTAEEFQLFSGESDSELVGGARFYLRLLRARMAPPPSTVQSWERFYTVFHPRLQRMVARCSVRGAEAEDLLQEVWVELSRKLADFTYDPRRGPLEAWLRVVVERKARALRRRKRGDDQRAGCSLAAVKRRREMPPDDVVENEELRAVISAAIMRLRDSLSPESYRILSLTVLDGRTASELAHELRLTREEVWARCHRAKQKLRCLLRPLLAPDGENSHDTCGKFLNRA